MNDELSSAVADVQAAHRRLIDTLERRLDARTARQPSRLPGWSVGHVVSHLARNADSFTWILEGCAAGEHRAQYPGGNEQRNADIEAGAGRPAEALADDVRTAAARLEETFAGLSDDAWTGSGRRVDGADFPARQLPRARLREVEVHHVDLGLGYEPGQWPEEFVSVALATEFDQLAERLDAGGRRWLLAWLLDRAPLPALELAPWQREHRSASPSRPADPGKG